MAPESFYATETTWAHVVVCEGVSRFNAREGGERAPRKLVADIESSNKRRYVAALAKDEVRSSEPVRAALMPSESDFSIEIVRAILKEQIKLKEGEETALSTD